MSTTIGIDRTVDRTPFEQSLATPAARQYAELQSKVLADAGVAARSTFVTLPKPAVRTHVLETGSGAPVVLVHGGGGFAAEWAGIMKPLSERFSVFAPDRPGCGLSDPFDYRKSDLRAHAVDYMGSLLDALELPRASLVGCSMGGYWSIAYALAHPERVERIVLVGAPAGLDCPVPPFMRLLGLPVVNRLIYATIARPSLESTRQVYRQVCVADIDKVPPDVLRLAHLSETQPGAIDSWLTMLERLLTLRGQRRDLMFGDELSRLAVPTLFAWGDRDAFGPPSIGQDACTTMKDARVEVVEGAAHLVHLDQPQRVASLVGDFLGASR